MGFVYIGLDGAKFSRYDVNNQLDTMKLKHKSWALKSGVRTNVCGCEWIIRLNQNLVYLNTFQPIRLAY